MYLASTAQYPKRFHNKLETSKLLLCDGVAQAIDAANCWSGEAPSTQPCRTIFFSWNRQLQRKPHTSNRPGPHSKVYKKTNERSTDNHHFQLLRSMRSCLLGNQILFLTMLFPKSWSFIIELNPITSLRSPRCTVCTLINNVQCDKTDRMESLDPKSQIPCDYTRCISLFSIMSVNMNHERFELLTS